MFAILVALSIDSAASLPTQCCCPEPCCPPVYRSFYLSPEPQVREIAPRRQRTDMVLLWNETHLNTLKTERTDPPMAARNLAIMHVAMFDAVNAIQRTHRPFRLTADVSPRASVEAAAAVAAHRTLSLLYPRQVARFDAVLDPILANIHDDASRGEGMALGQRVADKTLEWRSRDGALATVEYVPDFTPGKWQPTPPQYRPPLKPHWPYMTCFAMTRGDQFRPVGPPALTSAEYTASFAQVKALGSVDSAVRTREQTEIAWFWADGEGTVTPPGHWNRIAQSIAHTRGLTLAENARLFALLNLALADAAVTCWDAKYHYNYWRPVTAIRQADRDNNPQTAADRTWTSLIPTPPFPSYSSGHSTFSAAGASILANFFGSDQVPFMTDSDGLRGVTRTFPSFSAAALEAGLSRIYGGIHYDFDNYDGLKAGRDLGNFIFRNYLLPAQPLVTRPGA